MDNGGDSSATTPRTPSYNTQGLQLPHSCLPPSEEHPPKQFVWVVFGATGHIGRSVIKAALAHDDLVTGVGRSLHDSLPAMQDTVAAMTPASPSLSQKEATQASSYLPLLCDVRIRETVDDVFKASLEHWGRVDVVVNCSGYGIIGACEDQDDFEIRDQFETNFWGTLNILQLSLPYFRGQKKGRYIIFSSVGGALGVPGLGPYCATKYAVEGLIESMLYETAAFNVRATLVEPGYVRRDDPPSSSKSKGKQLDTLPTFGHFSIKPASAPYDNPTAPSGHAKRIIQWLGDSQPTSAAKSGELVWQLAHCHHPPLRLLLGSFAVESVRERLRGITEEIEDWQDLRFKRDEDEEEGETKTNGEDEGEKAPSQTDGNDDGFDVMDADEDGELDAAGGVEDDQAKMND